MQTGIFGGSKKVFCRILGSDFVLYKSAEKASKELVRVQLTGAEVRL